MVLIWYKKFDMAYGNFKDLNRRTVSDEKLHNKTFNCAKNAKYNGYQKRIDLMVYKYFDKESGSSI